MKRRAEQFLLSLAAAAATLLVAEAAIALLDLAPDYKFYPGPFIPCDAYDYRMKPDYRGYQGKVRVELNRHGLRGSDYGPEKEAYRLLVLGDSLAFGWGVEYEDAFPRLLEKQFREDGYDVAVIDGAVPGYSTWHEQRYLAAHVDEIRPDAVLIALFGNDYREREWVANKRGTLTKRGMEELRSDFVETIFNNPFFSRHSGVYRLLKNAVRNLIYEAHDRRFEASLWDLFVPDAAAAEPGGGWETCYEQLGLIRDLLAARGIALYILDLTALPDVSRALKKRGYVTVRYVEEDRARNTLPKDGHPNARGHQAIFQEVYPFLLERLGLSDQGPG